MSAPSLSELELALACTETVKRGRVLGAFVYDILGSMADARRLSCDRRHLLARASRFDVKYENAGTELGNLLSILERGAQTSAELALLSAFAAHGCLLSLADMPARERAVSAERLIARLDWLELGTSYRLLACLVSRVQGDQAAHAGVLRQALFRAVLRDDAAAVRGMPLVQAHIAWRMSTLARLGGVHSVRVLRALRDQATDPATHALSIAYLSALARESDASGNALRVQGVSRAPSRSFPIALARWLSGFALLQALQRFVFALLWLRRELEIELRDEALWVRRRTSFLGRTLRSSEACYALHQVTGAFRRARFALLRSLVGVLSLSLGLLIGGFVLLDGSRGGAPLLLVIGAGLVAAGAGIDLALNVLWPGTTARVDLQVDLRGARPVRVSHVEQIDADRLLEALSLRLSR
jgi:hypothetical protein